MERLGRPCVNASCISSYQNLKACKKSLSNMNVPHDGIDGGRICCQDSNSIPRFNSHERTEKETPQVWRLRQWAISADRRQPSTE
jgi:hypothetical protein